LKWDNEDYGEFLITTGNMKFWNKFSKNKILSDSKESFNFKEIEIKKSSLANNKYSNYWKSGIISMLPNDSTLIPDGKDKLIIYR
jgi:hypothetical protein